MPRRSGRYFSSDAKRVRPGPDDDAVSDVVGSIMLIAITIVLSAVMAGLIFSFKGPENAIHADLEVRIDSGDGVWGNANEHVQVHHLGGEPLVSYASNFVFTIGGTTTSYSGNALLSAFSDDGDGKFTIGETWISPNPIDVEEDTAVDVAIVAGNERPSTVLASGIVTGLGFVGAGSGSCAGDVTPPFVSSWIQVPANVQSTYVGTVDITATIADCTGVDQTVVPHLIWSVTPGGSPSGNIVMTPIGSNKWQGTIPSQVWSLSATKTLQYYVGPMRDVVTPVPNTAAASVTRTDAIGPFTTYVNTNSPNFGTVSNFANAQSASDASAEAALAEGLTGSAGSVTLLAGVPPVSSVGPWSSTSEVVVSDGVWATSTPGSSDNPNVRYLMTDQAGTPGAINSVIVKLEQSICPGSCALPVGLVNDGWRLQACYTTGYLAGICSAQSSTLAGTSMALGAPDGVLQYDISALRPGTGSWSWTDINNLEIIVTPTKSGSYDGTFRIDQVFLTVGYIPGYAVDVEFRWSAVPAGTSQTLGLNYRSTVDTYSVQVFDPTASGGVGAFNTRGSLLSAATLTPWSYVMTSSEYNHGAPRIRFIDTTPTSGSQGNLFIEYARITTI